MEYTLDYITWRCGDNGTNRLGEGDTELLNREGFMCCIGQFLLQEGFKKDEIFGCVDPECVDPYGTCETQKSSEFLEGGRNSDLAVELMRINDDDDPYIDVQRKVDKIRKRLEEEGHTLKLTNFPKQIK